MCPPAQLHGGSIFADNRKIRCALVHEHAVVRHGLRRLLEDEPDLEVVSEAGDTAEALKNVFELRPDVVLADADTMGVTAEDAEHLLLKESPRSRVFFLGVPDANDSAESGELVRNETGYVSPHTSAAEFVAMVKGCADDKPSRIHEVVRKSEGEDDWFGIEAPSARKRSLTAREREVLKLLAEGQTVRSAAGVLGLSAKTVDAHKFNLMRKLGIHNKAELVMWAIQKKVVKLPANF